MSETSETFQEKSIRFAYEKSAQHRTAHATGAWAANTPSGMIQVAFFNDVRDLPASCEGDLDNSSICEETEGLIREVEFTLLIHPEVAKSLVDLISYILERTEGKRS